MVTVSTAREHRAQAVRKLALRITLSIVATVAIICTIVYPTMWWLAVWIPVLVYQNCREWLKLLVNGFFQCHVCRKLKGRKHLSAIDSLPKPAGRDKLDCCDACAKVISVHLERFARVKSDALEHIQPGEIHEPGVTRWTRAPRGSQRRFVPVCDPVKHQS